ncbi:TetR family transcriptional regulator [Oxalobacteraceae bacterium R-40]|uniref:TetR family transcriptional regulator n=1 Tax=Keguizhuia sedimenti TaxID=3064264 RepID=A0ABU1BM88_9BURK|nr:TetR family transcriptional regulator [Oxalobacteraceae bacterium R-40]
MVRCTKEEAQETRTRILDAAENVFQSKGVARTSLADVAEAAEVTRGAIYWHFKNKTDLFEAMCQRVRLPMEAMIEANADLRESDPLGQVRGTAIFVLQQTAIDPHSRKVRDIIFHKCEFVDVADPISMRRQQCHSESRGNIERDLRNAQSKGQLPADLDIPLAAITLHATIGGILSNWLFAPESFDLAAEAERLVDACLDMVRNAPSLRKK